MVQVAVVYGSLFARLAGKPREVLALERATIAGLVEELTQRYQQPFVDALIDPADHDLKAGVSVLINGTLAPSMAELREGDEVVLIQSFGGG